VSVRALLPENAGTDLTPMPQALPPRRIPYHPSLAALCLLWAVAGLILYYKPRPKPVAPPAPPPAPEPPKSLGQILEPLALKAARKTITTEEKVLLEQTVLRYWAEKLEVSDLDTNEQYEIIREDPEGGVLLGALERWLYQPASHILTSEVTKALQPYFDIPAPGSGPLPSKDKKDSSLEEGEDDEDNADDAEDSPANSHSSDDEDEEEEEDPPRPKRRGKSASNPPEKTKATPPPESNPPPVGRRPGYRRRR
jgi:hypothetical protein